MQFDQAALEAIRHAMMEQGHPFQHRALAEAGKAFTKDGWAFEVVEFPVHAAGDTRIDFILRAGPYYMVVECKRVNLDYSRWVFARAPLVRRHPSPGGRRDYFFYDHLLETDYGPKAFCRRVKIGDVYQIAFVVRGPKPKNLDAEAIEKTVRQAVRGANGFANFVIGNGLPGFGACYIIPAVFTTADLIVTDIDLFEKTDLKTGAIEAGDIRPRGVPWLYYEYHAEPTIRHDRHQAIEADDNTLSNALEKKYTRTVPIVNAESIQRFLLTFSRELLSP